MRFVWINAEWYGHYLQYIPRNMHTVLALLCFVVVIHWLIFPYPSGLLHWHCGNLTIAPVPAKQPWWKWINTLSEFITNDYITTTKQSTTKPCAYFLGYTVLVHNLTHTSKHNTPRHKPHICRDVMYRFLLHRMLPTAKQKGILIPGSYEQKANMFLCFVVNSLAKYTQSNYSYLYKQLFSTWHLA